MKKFSALMMLGVLLVSMVPMVFAQDAQVTMRERIQDLRVDSDRLQQVREMARDRAEGARERYQDRRESLRQLREDCINNESDECQQLREDAKQNTKEFLLSAADRMLGVLDNLLVRIENARMPQEQKDDLVARVESKIAAVQAAREQIELLTDESTREEFNAAAAALRSAWSGAADDAESVRDIVREGVGRVAVERFAGVLAQAERLTLRLEQIKARLNASDVDTSSFDAALAQANAKVDELKAALDAGDMPAAAEVMREVKQSLADARRALAEILQELKENYRDAAVEISRSATESRDGRTTDDTGATRR